MPDWRDTLRTHLRTHEGFVPHMYLCTAGGLTIGIGHLIVSSSDSSDPLKLREGLRTIMRADYEFSIPLPPMEPVAPVPQLAPWAPPSLDACTDPYVLRVRCGVVVAPPTALEIAETEANLVLQDRVDQLRLVNDGDNKTKPYTASRWTGLTRCRMTEAGALKLKSADINQILAQVKSRFTSFAAFPDNAKIAVMDLAFQYGAGGANKHFGALITKQDWTALAATCAAQTLYVARNKDRADFFTAAAKEVDSKTVK